jgi:hypothetical protein
MHMRASWRVALPFMLALVGAACGDASRSAESDEDAAGDVDLALQVDTAPATFRDTAIAVVPGPEPRPQQRRRAPERVRLVESEPEPPRISNPPMTQPPPPAPEPTRTSATVPVGTTIVLTLDETLSTETNVAGDGFTASVQEPVLSADGMLLVPVGATVRGRVTHVQKSGRVGETAVLNVTFEAISFGDASYALSATVVQANPERVSRASTGEQVGKVAAGAAAGAILGRVLGGKTRDAIKGAVIGAAAGTAIALGTADVDAVLKAGSTMVIRTDAPITLN